MKKYIFILIIGFFSVFISGCNKDILTQKEVIQFKPYKKSFTVFDQYSFEVMIVNNEIIYPKISDDSFKKLISGFVTLPEGVSLSPKFKTMVLEQIANQDQKYLHKKGFYLTFNEAGVKHYNIWGQPAIVDNYNYLLSIGVDPHLSEEEIKKILLEREENREN